MADEPKKDQPEDIQSILSDLDAILTDMGGKPKSAEAKPAAPPKIEVPPQPKEPPKIPAPAPVELPAPPAQSAEIKPAAPAPAPVPAPGIELAPRAGLIKPPANPTPPPKTGEPPKIAAPAPAAPAATPAAPKPAAAAPAAEALPADTPKDQIRRVAYVYTFACREAKNGFAGFLSGAARTISKKPLFLREVLSLEVENSSDPNAIVEKARQAKAVAILAVAEGWPAAKNDDLSEACARAGLLFRSVASADTQKKSTAVDVIVDMMLLSGEA